MHNFASDNAMQFTLRELTRLTKSPPYWMGLAAIALILAIIGPFYTFASLQFSERLVYWLLMAIANFMIGFSVSLFVGHVLYSKGMGELLSRILAGIASGFPIAAFVWLVNIYIYRFDMREDFGFLLLLAYCIIIATGISMVFYLVSLEFRKYEKSAENKAAPSPTFIRRLPPHLGSNVISLEAQDHYVNVTTDKGSELILIRLSDAIEEIAGIDGLRIHRSYWVANSAVKGTAREDGKLVVTLSNGTTLPVSRTYAGSVRKAVTQIRSNA